MWVTDIDGVAQIRWTAAIKPLVLDEILWVAFMPDVDVSGPRKRLTRRINGAFIVEPVEWAAAPQKRPSEMSSVLASQRSDYRVRATAAGIHRKVSAGQAYGIAASVVRIVTGIRACLALIHSSRG